MQQQPQQQAPQLQQAFDSQLTNISGNPFGNISYQTPNTPQQQQQQQQPYSSSNFNQFSSTPKLHHIDNPITSLGAGDQQRQQVMLIQNSPHRPRPQFQSPPGAGGGGNTIPIQQQTTPGGYQTFNLGGGSGPRLPNPHQQQQQMNITQNISQGSMWNQNQTSPNQSQFMQQQQQLATQPPQQQQVANSGLPQMSGTYLTHHDYALPTSQSNVPQMSHFQDNIATSNPNSLFLQRVATSSSANRLTHVPISNASNSMNLMGQMQQQGQQQGVNQMPPSFQQQTINPQIHLGLNNFSANPNTQQMPMAQLHQPQNKQFGNFPQQIPQMNSGTNAQTNVYNRFSFQQPQTGQNSLPQVINDISTQNVNNFQNTSPNQNNTFRATYPSMQVQRATVPSPRPTPPPSRTPDQPQHTSPNSQGNVQQSNVQQQLQQLASPPNNNSITSSPYQHVVARSEPIVSHNQNNTNSVTFSAPMNNNQLTNQNKVAVVGNLNVNQGMSVTNTSHIGPISPNVGNQTGTGNQNVNMEIQYLQQQIQQIHNMPQTQQLQQKMLDLQERVRMLRSTQELEVQRQKQQLVPNIQQNLQPNIRPTIIQIQQPGPRQPLIQIRPQYPNQQQTQQQPQKILIVSSAPVVQQQQQLQASKPQQFQIHQQQQQQPPQLIQPNIQQTVVPQQQSHFSISPAPSPQKLQIVKQQSSPAPPQNMMSPSQVPTSTNIPQQQPQQCSQQPKTSPPNQVPSMSSTPLNSVNNVPVVQIQLGPPPTMNPTQVQLQTIPQQQEEMGGNQENMDETEQISKQKLAQEKANKIVAEAVARAQAAGNTQIPRILTPPPIPSTVGDVETTVGTTPLTPAEGKKKKKGTGKKKEKKPKEPKGSKSPKDVTSDIEHMICIYRPPATFLKKKKKKGHDSDASDVELKITPPQTPDENVEKRRSARNTKRKKYLDDVDLNLSDEETQDVDVTGVDNNSTVVKPVQFFVDNPAEEDAIVVEKILGMRLRKSDKDVDVENDDTQSDEEVEEFFVKYKNYSYLHCEWKTAEELERDKRIQSKIKRFKMKKLSTNNYFAELDDEELFNPDYVEVDRVLDVSVTFDPTTTEEVTHFLVKWRGLPYEDSTWELQQDVDPEKVKMFYKYRDPPEDEEARETVARPTPDQWQKIEETKEYKGGNKLREYQLEGVNWLLFSWYNQQNSILADEMGLGKTVQSITFLNEIVNYGIKGPFLVVVPLSTLGNWQREFETWTDINAIVYHGSAQSRYMLQEFEMYYKDKDGKRIPDIYKFQALITTYELIISDCEMLCNIEWRCLVVDEAHRLKNKNCRLMEGLRMFDCVSINNNIVYEHRVLLSGTPLQNNVEELFSLLNFLEPERFKSSAAFLADFGNLQTDEQVENLKSILKPMMLRRLKEDVEKNLAAKEETIIEVELTNIQKKYYRAILERNFTFLSKGVGTSANVPNLLNTMMELRKCCNHPYLVKGAEEKILEEIKEKHDQEQIMLTMVNSSGKMVLLDKLLPKLKQNGHKVLVFSQMIRVLDILEDYLIHKQYLYERLDGRIRGNLRQEAIDRFSKPDSDRFVFLLCTRAGGLGINLTAADTVIIYDSDWNPQNDLQAQARCHRIGQTREVKVYRLITRNSYEREMFDKASLKLGLDKAVLQSMGGEKATPQAQLSKKEIENLLRKGAYGALMEDDSAGDKFCEEDIDQILKRRTQVIQIESEGKGSTFAKASFSMSSNRSDIDINDPNFWQKWAKKADLDADELKHKNDLIIQEPRQRKQTARYGNDESVLDMSELESSSDSDEDEEDPSKRGRKSGRRKGRRNRGDDDEDFEGEEVGGNGFSRWGRWDAVLSHGRFKRKLVEKDVETISRALLIYSLKHYKGDERIKEFIWDLISPSNQDGTLKNHSGLSAPVPRGRKGKNRTKKEGKEFDPIAELEKGKIDLDPEIILRDSGYRKHLHRHANKVLLRVRLLYYLKQEIIGEEADKVFQGLSVNEIDIPSPCPDGEPPVPWWDEDADKSLLIGVFKHGYEKYNLMRQDPALVFLERCGPPDSAALAAEMKDDDDDLEESRLETTRNEDQDEEASVGSMSDTLGNKKSATTGQAKSLPNSSEMEEDKLPFPTPSDINTRLRRVITGYQRNHKRQLMKNQQKERKMERRERVEQTLKEREVARRFFQQSRWSRREETDFYRVISSFGVEFDPDTGRYKWDRFRQLARLEKKYEETLTEYFQAFYHMCMRVCKKFKNDDDALPPNNIYVEPITEERASRCLARIDLLNKIRTEILTHPKLEERIMLCQSSWDLPSWWINGKHDKDLLLGAASCNKFYWFYYRNGLVRTDYHMLSDPMLSFKELLKNKHLQIPSSPSQSSSPHLGKDEDDEVKDLVKTIKEQTELKLKRENKIDIKPEHKVKVESPKVKIENEEKVKVENEDVKSENVENGDEQEKLSDKNEQEEKEDSETSVLNLSAKSEVKSEIENEHSAVKSEKMDIDEDDDDKTDVEMNDNEDDNEDNKEMSKEKDQIKSEKLNGDETTVKSEEEEEKVKVEKIEEETQCDVDMNGKEDVKMEEKEEKPESLISGELKKQNGFNREVSGRKKNECIKNGSLYASICVYLQDRVIFHRLEHICYCVEHGEWPFPKKMTYSSLNYDSRSATPMGSLTPRDDPELSASDAGDSLYDGVKVNKSLSDLDKDFEVQMTEGDGLKMTFHKRRGMGSKSDFPEGSRIHQILNQSAASAASSDNESQSELSSRSQVLGHSPRHSPHHYFFSQTPAEMLANGAQHGLEFDPVLLNRSVEPLERKRGRRPRVDPMLLDPTKLTGDENVSVINRLTGKKITGAKAPPLRYLAEWLEQNPLYDVEPKWAELVKSKGSLPKTLLSRLGTPLERRNRGRPPRESNMSSSLLSENPFAAVSMAGLSAFPAASLMSGFPKLPIGMPFGALPNIGMGNPLLGLSGFGIPGLNMASVLSKSSESESKKDKDVSPNKKEQSKSESKSPSSITPHPSFPMLYNPLMFNPLLAAQAAQAAQAQGLNFSLPTSLPTSFATLAQAGLMNGQGDSDLEEGEIKRYSKVEQDAAEDLSVKSSSAKRSKEDRHERHHRHKRERHHDKSVSKISVSHFQDEPTDLSMKPKSSSHIDSQKSSNSSTPKESSNKMKTKIQSSFKLNKIVDSLKDKVQKMETKTDLKDKRSKLDDILSRMGGGSSKNTEKEESVENDNDHNQRKDEEMSEKNDDSMMSDS
ncbi:hypothetical protein KUTeg_019343 [Tegillarca granosa]|uniref:Chromodomain-helicase-DNA-binding protein 8 n=1 Tax=Tegillarca granosa TaxID=220873 RepID=A0ABQ9ECA4_TEGGR|nr:hypothetical protein KUTeg_019343 [Tegillarca granosa]